MALMLDKALKEQGLTQAALAARLKVKQSTVSRWATRRVPAERAREVAKALGLQPSDLRPDLYPRQAA